MTSLASILFGWWTKNSGSGVDEGQQRHVPRKIQFNTTVSPDMVDWIRTLAAEYGVPFWVIVEHALEISGYVMAMAAVNEKKKQRVHDHLINKHLLATELKDHWELGTINGGPYPVMLRREILTLVDLYRRYLRLLIATAAGKKSPDLTAEGNRVWRLMNDLTGRILQDLRDIEFAGDSGSGTGTGNDGLTNRTGNQAAGNQREDADSEDDRLDELIEDGEDEDEDADDINGEDEEDDDDQPASRGPETARPRKTIRFRYWHGSRRESPRGPADRGKATPAPDSSKKDILDLLENLKATLGQQTQGQSTPSQPPSSTPPP